MGLWQRIKLIFRAKASKAVDRAEDPREMLDYSYERQMELLVEVRRGIADVTTARKRIELQAQQLQRSGDKLEGQAKQALGADREDLARQALARRVTIARELTDLQAQHEQLKGQEERMIESARQLEAKLQAFRSRKETMKANYSAAEARARVNEAAAGISTEMSDLGLAVHRAEDKIAQMEARAGALEELAASGVLEGTAATSDRIEAELNKAADQTEVELELMRIKGELGAGSPQSTVTVDRPEAEAAPAPQEGEQQDR
jgi:phage shock protein A